MCAYSPAGFLPSIPQVQQRLGLDYCHVCFGKDDNDDDDDGDDDAYGDDDDNWRED